MRLRRRFGQLLALLAMGLGLYVLWYTGLVMRLQHHNPTQSAYMERAEAQGKVQQSWRDYDQISDYLKRAVLISEDARFTEHTGFDWDGIRYAIKRNMEAGKPVAGGSTITQQLAKNLYLSGKRSYLRKAQEAMIAVLLEICLSKRRILELYLNMAQWGHQIYGAEAAARHHFQVSAAQLSPFQAAQLAAMLPRPNYYDFKGPTDHLNQRANWILEQMQLVRIPDPALNVWPASPAPEPAEKSDTDTQAPVPAPSVSTDTPAQPGSTPEAAPVEQPANPGRNTLPVQSIDTTNDPAQDTSTEGTLEGTSQ
ncbi:MULTISPECIES: monofunctional biosynthetic peptidoglycan transglycosylase [Alcanivorax]|uniref:monofunctional biosynthetic peptidoglycan transglycosylase n=1 Tax=Alcanivorax TaxID=59753 RepID=UPI0004B9B55E|nr:MULTISPECIES: monofunctional biosynthetic peptidoglycan transglycosylase [Alcanivorax]